MNSQDTKAPTISKLFGKTIHTPYNVYRHSDRLVREVGEQEIQKRSRYKVVQETRIAAVAALVIYKITSNPAYVNIPDDDPPDAYILQQSKEKVGQLDITTIEITSYRNNNGETLVEQLKRTKVSENPRYTDEYVIIVELFTKEGVDPNALREYLNQIKIHFPVWLFFPKIVNGNSVAEVTIVNPKTHVFEVDIAEAIVEQGEKGIKGKLNLKRASNVKKVGIEPTELDNDDAPWIHRMR